MCVYIYRIWVRRSICMSQSLYSYDPESQTAVYMCTAKLCIKLALSRFCRKSPVMVLSLRIEFFFFIFSFLSSQSKPTVGYHRDTVTGGVWHSSCSPSLQCNATHCNAVYYTAHRDSTRCNTVTLQPTALHCIQRFSGLTAMFFTLASPLICIHLKTVGPCMRWNWPKMKSLQCDIAS